MKGDKSHLDTWPEPCAVAQSKATVDLRKLPPEKKHRAWRWIKEHHPALAQLLTELYSDPVMDEDTPPEQKSPEERELDLVRELVQAFDCTILVEKIYLPSDIQNEQVHEPIKRIA